MKFQHTKNVSGSLREFEQRRAMSSLSSSGMVALVAALISTKRRRVADREPTPEELRQMENVKHNQTVEEKRNEEILKRNSSGVKGKANKKMMKRMKRDNSDKI